MVTSYYSTVFEQTAEQVWSVIHDFGNYTWAETVIESHIEDGKSGMEVGAIRYASIANTTTYHRQQLLVYSDIEHSYTYNFCEPYPYPVRNFVATLRVTPIIDGNKAFVEWFATFDCEVTEQSHWKEYFAHEVWAKLLESLKKSISH